MRTSGNLKKMMTALALIIMGTCLVSVPLPSVAETTDAAWADPLTPVRTMIRKGLWLKAEKVLKKLIASEMSAHQEETPDDEEHPHLDKVEALALMGIMDVHAGRYRNGISRLSKALKLRPMKTSLWIYLAQARFATRDFAGMLEALEKCHSIGLKLPAWHVMKSRGLVETGLPGQAIAAIDNGLKVFPDNSDLLRERAMQLFEMGLHREAIRTAHRLFKKNPRDRQAFVLMGDSLRKSGNFRQSVEILLQASVLFPEDTLIKTQLAYSYAMGGHSYLAARLFEKLTRAGRDFSFETADQYRLANRFRDALKWNMKVSDRNRRLNQRLSIAVSAGKYALACSLNSEFDRMRDTSDNTRYQLAYACMKHGSASRTLQILDKIADPALKTAVDSIRKAVTESL